MSDVDNLPKDHPWWRALEWDRLLFRCKDCDISIPVTAADTQAGIVLYCPECDGEMEYDHQWRDE